MGSFSVWHWLILLCVLGIPAVIVGLIIWFVSRASKRRQLPTEDRLRELSSLKSKGLISEDEYERQRSAILLSV